MWRRGVDAPETIFAAQAVVMGESVYVGGGEDNVVYEYCWRRDIWNTLPRCPVVKFGLTQYRGRLTIVGGLDGKGATARIYHFSSSSQQWQESIPSMPTARHSATVVSHPVSSPKPPAIAVCGGQGDGGVFSGRVLKTVEVFCHSTSQWYAAKPMPIPLFAMTTATVGDITYFLGGMNSTFSFNPSACFFVHFDSLIDEVTLSYPPHEGSQWKKVKKTPHEKPCGVSLRGSVVAIGGTNWDILTAVYLLASSGSWERVMGGDLPEGRFMSTATCLPSGELMVVGGSNGNEATRTLFIATVAD